MLHSTHSQHKAGIHLSTLGCWDYTLCPTADFQVAPGQTHICQLSVAWKSAAAEAWDAKMIEVVAYMGEHLQTGPG